MNQKNTIIYFGMGCFTDTDVTVVKQLQKEYSVHWYVLHQPHDPYPVSFYVDFVKNSGVKLHMLHITNRRRSFKVLKLMFKTFTEIVELSPSLIYSCCFDFYFSLAYLIKAKSIPLVFGVHDVIQHSDKRNSIFYHLSYRFSLFVGDVFLQFSSNQNRVFKQLYPKLKSSMVGMSIKDFGEAKGEKHIFDNSTIKILFFGSIQYYKGYDLLINAFEKILNMGINNIRLSFLGECTPKNELYLKSLVKSYDKYNLRLHFIDNDEIPQIYNEHDLAIFPYREATQSGPLMIAINYCLPIIAANHSCFADILGHADCSILYDSNNNNALIEILQNVSRMSNTDYQRLKDKAIELNKQYSEEVIVDSYIKVFNELIKCN